MHNDENVTSVKHCLVSVSGHEYSTLSYY